LVQALLLSRWWIFIKGVIIVFKELTHAKVEKKYSAYITLQDGFEFPLSDTRIKSDLNQRLITHFENALLEKSSANDLFISLKKSASSLLLAEGFTERHVGFYNKDFKRCFNSLLMEINEASSNE
jgi:hypothetical protein